jgi:hypothetical protein
MGVGILVGYGAVEEGKGVGILVGYGAVDEGMGVIEVGGVAGR